MTTLVASAARTTSGDSGTLTPVRHPELLKFARFVLNVTAAATGAGDKLDVFVQQTYDGTNYDDLLHFTQVLGNGGAKTFIAEWQQAVTPESELRAPADASLAAGVLQGGKIGASMRIKWVITDAGGGVQSFTFGVTGEWVYR